MSKKERLDNLLVQKGLANNCSQAQRLVMAGQVRVNGEIALKPSTPVSADVDLRLESRPRFVSRGGEKLEAALQAFAVPTQGRICADVGASTGGFSDCLLQHGAAKVYALDVGEGILDWKLRQDARVVVLEGVNARQVDKLPEPINLATVDVSFISLKIILPVVRGWFASQAGGDALALIKPQFEVERSLARRGKGVIRDPAVHRQVLKEVLFFAEGEGYAVLGLIRSPLLGPKGNAEFLAWLRWPGEGNADLELLVDLAIQRH